MTRRAERLVEFAIVTSGSTPDRTIGFWRNVRSVFQMCGAFFKCAEVGANDG